MGVDIHFAGGEYLRTAIAYEAAALARGLSGDADREQPVGDLFRVRLIDNNEVLVNPAAVAYLRDISE